jgi:hypothetical protein
MNGEAEHPAEIAPEAVARAGWQQAPNVREPAPEHDEILEKFRSDTLISLRRTLSRIPERPRFQDWRNSGRLALGAALGAVPGLFGMVNYPWEVGALYVIVVGILFLVAGLCYRAARGMQEDRSTTLRHAIEDLDHVLKFYGLPIPTDESETPSAKSLRVKLGELVAGSEQG